MSAHRVCAVFALAAGLAFPDTGAAQVLKVGELTSTEIAALDRRTTVVILPGGILEQHGGHLPSFSDGFMNQATADSLAAAVARRPGHRALVFPMIPLGTGGANEMSGKYSWPGTYAVRSETLRSIFMDLATELGEQGFRWVFIVHNHGSPAHNRALDEAGDFFRDTYGGRMVNLTGIEPDWALVGAARAGLVTAEIDAEDAGSVHAGLSETSRVMYVRPDLVQADRLRATRSLPTPPPQLGTVARQVGWPGYFGAPRHANVALGRAEHEAVTRAWTAIALRILDGADERQMQRYADMMLAIPMIQAGRAASFEHERSIAAKQAAWLERRK